MKIGIDLDGVVIDSETSFRTYEEIYSIKYLNGRKISNREEPKYQHRYNWTKEEQLDFNQKYLLKGAKESPIMAGFIPVYNILKEQGHELIVITARGGLIEGMKEDAIRLLKENNIEFDKYYWCVENKLDICQKEKIDIMVDDDWRIIKKLSDNNIKTLYFRDTNMKRLKENKYIKEVNNWGDIYRYITER